MEESHRQAKQILNEYGIKFLPNSATILWLIAQIEQAEFRGALKERARSKIFKRIYPLLEKAVEGL